MAIQFSSVKGEDKGKIILYALSTCIWCGKTKKLLDELNVGYDFVDVDLLNYEDQQEALKEVKKYNPGGGFPTMVIDDSESIVGFNEAKVREKLAR